MLYSSNSHNRVLIVGAGPTGLTAAAFLAKQNIEFDLIESRSGPVDDSRALGVHARTLEFMSMLGLDQRFIEQGHKTRYMTFHRGDRKLFKLDFDSISQSTRYPYMLVLPQSRSERILVDHLVSQGAHIQWNTTMTDFSEDKECVMVTIERPNGSIIQQRYDYVIGCDGAASQVRTKLGIPFEGETYPLRFLLSEVQIHENAIDRASSHVFMGKDTTVAVIPQPDNIYRIVGPDFSAGDQEPAVAGATQVGYDDFAAFLKSNDLLQHVEMHDPSRLVSYRIHKRVAAKYRQGRVFIAGDAAHIHSPAGGQGMNTGLNDVANLTWKLAAVMNDGAPGSLLDSYEHERRAAAISVVTNADAAMMKVVSRKLGPRLFFDHVAPLITRFYQPRGLLEAMAQISWTCPRLQNHDHELATELDGLRMPDIPLSDGVFSNARLGGRNLVGFISGTGDWVNSIKARNQMEIHQLHEPLATAHKSSFKGLVLCRPDGYIATSLSVHELTAGSKIPSLCQLAS